MRFPHRSLYHTRIFLFFFFNLVDCSSQVRTCTICSSFRRNFFFVAGITFDRITGRESRGILVCHDPGLWASESCNNLSNSLHPPTNGEIWKQFFTICLWFIIRNLVFWCTSYIPFYFFFYIFSLDPNDRINIHFKHEYLFRFHLQILMYFFFNVFLTLVALPVPIVYSLWTTIALNRKYALFAADTSLTLPVQLCLHL